MNGWRVRSLRPLGAAYWRHCIENLRVRGGWEGPARLLCEEALDAAEDLGVHGGREAASLGVLLAGVIDAEEAGGGGGELGFGAVGERESGARGDRAALLEDFEVGVPGDFSEGED